MRLLHLLLLRHIEYQSALLTGLLVKIALASNLSRRSRDLGF